MLQLKNIANVEPIKNESDFYLKMKILIGSRHVDKEPLYYWSTLGPQKSFIEIGIKKYTGSIHEITIISMPEIRCQKVFFEAKQIIEKKGIPLFSTHEWLDPNILIKEYYIRKNKDFEVYTTPNSVSIVFSSNEISLKVINDPIVFGFDSNDFLCSIQMLGMKLNEEGFLESVSD